MKLIIQTSPEQEEVIADHLFYGKPLGMLPDERAWILNHVVKMAPGHQVLSAKLNVESAEWILELKEHH
jgi:hypothetical protein